MNLIEINFFEKLSRLTKEAFAFKKYKAMPSVLAVFAGILMIPFVIASFLAIASFAVLSFSFTVAASPVKSLHALVNKEGKEVRHATQFIVYFISWPFIFFCYVMMTVLLLLIIPTYTLLSILLYVWSFGGFKFHLFMNEADDISIDVSKKYLAIPLVFVIVGYVLVAVLPLLHLIFGYASYAWDSWELANIYSRAFPYTIYPKYFGINLLFMFVYSIICAPYPKADKSVK
jgi:hypothetical protein